MAALLVYNAGMRIITDRLLNLGAYPAPVFIEWGSGATAAVATDVDIQTGQEPTLTTRVTGTGTQQTTTQTNDTAQVAGTVTAAGTVTIREVALFTTASQATANMFLRANHGDVALVINDSIAYTVKWQIT